MTVALPREGPLARAQPRPAASASLLQRGLAVVIGAALLWFVFGLYRAGQPMTALGVLALGTAALVVYGTARSMAWKYLFPGVAGMLLFVAFPLLYTVQIGFTNYSSRHLLDQNRAAAYLLDQVVVDEARAWGFDLIRDGSGLRLLLSPPEGTPSPQLLSPPLPPAMAGDAAALPMQPMAADAPAPSSPLNLRDRIAERERLQSLRLQLPGGSVIGYAGVREYGPIDHLWKQAEGGALVRNATAAVYRPNLDSGYFETDTGERLQPGFKVGIGFDNYRRMLLDADFRGPFIRIFIWTVLFAGLTVLFSTVLGMTLAVLLEWPQLKHRALYRTLLFLPYAVPGFISILVFKGLFNQNFGEINAILDAVFGIRPAWFADPLLAKTMLLIVNTWLGYPYVMILCSGLLKSIPADLYEASAIAGAGPLLNFWKITAPLIARPLMPLLIAAFAFNFNNFVLISLLTDGRPDFLDTKLPAGTTDILVSYTYRIAFTDSGQNFGLAAAISTLIFVMVAVMALTQLKFATRPEREAG